MMSYSMITSSSKPASDFFDHLHGRMLLKFENHFF